MIEALQLEFMRNAVLAGLLAGLACGIIGTFVVVNRIVFISGGIAHAAYGGVGLAFFLGLPVLIGILGFSLVVALIVAVISLKARERADTIIGVLWALGMALGVILVDLTPGYNVDLMSYLFGSILTVPPSDLYFMLILDLLIAAAVGYFYHDLMVMSYDQEFARVRGVRVSLLHCLLMVMVALAVVMMVRVVGLILVMALMTIAPFIAEKYCLSLAKMMLVSVFLNIGFTWAGLWLSYSCNLTSGPSIIMVAGACFFISLALEALGIGRRVLRPKV